MIGLNQIINYDEISFIWRRLENWIIKSKYAFEMYYEEVRKRVFPELEANCFIRKPITNEDLIQKVKDILKIQYTL